MIAVLALARLERTRIRLRAIVGSVAALVLGMALVYVVQPG